MDELFCFGCGGKDPTFKEPGWIVQFNGMLCSACVIKYPGTDVKRTPITEAISPPQDEELKHEHDPMGDRMKISEKVETSRKCDTHLVDPSSPLVYFPIGGGGTMPGHSLAYCGATCQRSKTKTFYEAVNYTGAGLAKLHPSLYMDICPECAELHGKV